MPKLFEIYIQLSKQTNKQTNNTPSTFLADPVNHHLGRLWVTKLTSRRALPGGHRVRQTCQPHLPALPGGPFLPEPTQPAHRPNSSGELSLCWNSWCTFLFAPLTYKLFISLTHPNTCTACHWSYSSVHKNSRSIFVETGKSKSSNCWKLRKYVSKQNITNCTQLQDEPVKSVYNLNHLPLYTYYI